MSDLIINKLKINADLNALPTVPVNKIEYAVAPCTSVVTGVLNNIFYSSDVLNDSVSKWNNMPFTNGHTSTSARTPVMMNEYQIGFVADTQFNNEKLTHNIYIDLNLLKEKNEDQYNNIVEKKVIEVSTGLFGETVQQSGIHNNVEYESVMKLINPDHLALLHNEVGACSIDDGCGIKLNKKEVDPVENEDKKIFDNIKQLFTKNEKINPSLKNNKELINNLASYDIATQARGILKERGFDTYIEYVSNDYLVFYDWNTDKTYKSMYSVENNMVGLSEQNEEGYVITEFVSKEQNVITNKKGADEMCDKCTQNQAEFDKLKANSEKAKPYLENQDVYDRRFEEGEKAEKKQETILNSKKDEMAKNHPELENLIKNAKHVDELTKLDEQLTNNKTSQKIVNNSAGGEEDTYKNNIEFSRKDD